MACDLAYMLRALATSALLLLCGSAVADEAGDEWLKRIDAAAQVSDAHLRLHLEVSDSRGTVSKREIEIWQKGTEKRLVRMRSPARLKGVGLLGGAKDSLHLFLPSYPPARRVIGSKRADAFMGTDFAIEDLSRMTYSGRFDAVVGSAEGNLTQLVLTPREDNGDSDTLLWVSNSGPPLVHKIEHIDGQGTPTRRLILEDYRTINGAHIAHAMRVDDLRRNRTTTAKVSQVQIGQGLDDRIFTLTHLERP